MGIKSIVKTGNMINYNNFTIEDFFHDLNFRKWILNPDQEIDLFWEKWLLDHPAKNKEVQIAREMVKAFHIWDVNWSKKEKVNLWKKILASNSKNCNKKEL